MLLKKKKWIFNIHLIIAMIVIIPLFIICISGAMLSYDKPIAKAINAIITPNSNKILNPNFADLISKFKAQNPSLDISSISYEANSRYYTISANQNGKNISYLVNDDGVILSKGGNKTAIIENKFNNDELKTALIAIMPNFTNFDSISISQSKPKHYTFNIKKANEQRVVTIDTDNPNLLTQTDASQNKNLARKVLDLHSGRAFGYLGEFVFCVASFIGGVIAILGFIITYARIKPKSAKNKI